MDSLRQVWSKSKLFRILLIIGVIYGVTRLAAQIWLSTEHMLPGQSETQIIPNDLQDYMNAATRLLNHEALYPPTDKMEYYQYPPIFALVIRPLLWISPEFNFIFNFFLRLAGYWILYIWWGRIFKRAKIKNISEIWGWMLPLWIVFGAFWSDLSYMNIYIITAMFATLFIDSILSENLFTSILWLTVLLQTKPHWAFALAVPMLLGRWRFFFKLLLATIIVNAAIFAGFLLVVGPAYGWQQLLTYPHFLASLSSSFPWRTMEMGFIGYNHSIMQIIIFLEGKSTGSIRLVIIFKFLLLVPLIIVCIRQFIHPAKRSGYEVPILALGLTFAVYLAIFIMLDMVWELSLGCAMFAFLLATHTAKRISRSVIWIAFIPYAFVDFWQFISYLVFGDKIITPNGYILSDYSIYFPIVMLMILIFYAVLIVFLLPKQEPNLLFRQDNSTLVKENLPA